jgi:outer membrane protein assembly factor BamA
VYLKCLTFFIFLTISHWNSYAEWETDYFPAVAYSPETSLMLGGVAVGSNGETETDLNSTLTAVAVYTLNKQTIVSLDSVTPFFEGSFKFRAKFHYSFFPKKYFGIGNNTIKDDFEYFTLEKKMFELELGKRLFSNFYIYIGGGLEHLNSFDVEVNKKYQTDNSPYANELFFTSILFSLDYDNRDNTLFSFSGIKFQFLKQLFKEQNSNVKDLELTSFDFRFYFPLFDNSSIAFQAMTDFFENDAKIPPAKLNKIGGSNLLRGYYKGRFRDNAIMAYQAAWRVKLGSFATSLFYGLGASAASIEDVVKNYFHHAYGAGLFYFINEEKRSVVRLDVGFSEGESSIYFDVSQSF